jgi:hypothetical protein
MVIDPNLEEAMKVTVIATGFDRGLEDRPRTPMPVSMPASRPTPVASVPSFTPAPPPEREEPDREPLDVPFYRKAIAHGRGDDPGGFGPNWSNVDDYDIPTVLRKQMD